MQKVIMTLSLLLCTSSLGEIPVASPSFSVASYNKGDDFADIVDATIGGVVSISTTQVIKKGEMFSRGESPFEDLFKEFFKEFGGREAPESRKVQGLGSGFIVHADKEHIYIVTNYHVVSDSKKISVKFYIKKEVEGQLYAYDTRTDLAVIRCPLSKFPAEERKKLRVLSWGNSEKVRVGHWVLAIGTPFGLGNTVTAGIISAKGRDLLLPGNKGADLNDYFQHNVAINSGNSGGCLLNASGQVIGINTVILTPNGGNVGIGFAISSSIAKNVVDQLIATKQVKRGWIGIAITKVPDEQRAHLGLKADQDAFSVGQVTPGGPGALAGLLPGDIITHYNEQPVSDNWRRLVSETLPNAQVILTIQRIVGGKVQSLRLKVKVGTSPVTASVAHTSPAQVAGLLLSPVTVPAKGQIGRDLKGLRVDAMERRQDEWGLKVKDVIIAMRYIKGREAIRHAIYDVKTFKAMMDFFKKTKQENVVLEVLREDPAGQDSIITLVTFNLENPDEKEE